MLPDCPVVPADSTYKRNAFPLVTGAAASVTVIPAGLYENKTRATGTVPPPSGITRTDPEAVTAPAPAVASFCEDPAGTEYLKLLLVTPAIVTLAAAPFGSVNCTFPVRAVSVAFTRKICVIQPWPSAKWGRTTVPVPGAAVGLITGSVDMIKSPRSLVRPRKAITPTGMGDVKLKVP